MEKQSRDADKKLGLEEKRVGPKLSLSRWPSISPNSLVAQEKLQCLPEEIVIRSKDYIMMRVLK